MSLIKTGGGVAAISGKTGGTVYARNKSGAYSRNWAKPVNPGTSRLTDVRSFFAGGSAAYSMLTATQIAAWAAYAATITRTNRQGDSYTPSGRQMFMEIYANMTGVAIAYLHVPSAFSNVPSITNLGAISSTVSGGHITALSLASIVDVIPGGAGALIVVEAAPLHKPSLTNVNTQFRQIYFDDDGAAPFDLLAGFTAVFGNPAVAGQTLSLRVRVIDEASGLGSTRMLVNHTV